MALTPFIPRAATRSDFGRLHRLPPSHNLPIHSSQLPKYHPCLPMWSGPRTKRFMLRAQVRSSARIPNISRQRWTAYLVEELCVNLYCCFT